MKQTGLRRIREALLPGTGRNSPVLLIVGAVEEVDGPGSIFDGFEWPTKRARSLRDFFFQVWTRPPRVVVCERDLPDGNWKDVLGITALLPCPPPLVVTSRMADDCLWAEVLNLGGYDVLAKPLDAQELRRTLNLAWDRWASQRSFLHDRPGASPVMRTTPRYETEVLDLACSLDCGARR